MMPCCDTPKKLQNTDTHKTRNRSACSNKTGLQLSMHEASF
jgi:hypothetical protein